MIYFIPAWYQQNQWCENEQSWRVRRMHTEFDDTVKQIQLFHRSGFYPYQIMLLSYAPNFRHFLHRQSVYRAPYWSAFDAIQQVRRRKAVVLSFHNLKWPESIEFIYSPFVVIAFLKGEKYAQIDFGEDGNPIRIDLYKEGKIYRRNIYDDRGFVSSAIIYEEEKPLYQEYLMENGIWKLRCYQKDGHVEINPKYPAYLLRYKEEEKAERFSQTTYVSMGAVIYEVLVSYLRLTERGDIFCIAMDGQHTKLLANALRDRRIILSFFSDRYSAAGYPEALDLVRRAGFIIADSRENLKKIRWEAGELVKNIMVITPYDTRIDLGISQQLSVQKILVPVDDVGEEIFGEMICLLGEYLLRNKDAQVHLFTRKADYDRKQRILERMRNELRAGGLPEGWAGETTDEGISENNLEMAVNTSVKFYVEQCVDELAVSKCMREQRLLVDLRDIPELYLQITAISMGIPQIVRTWTEFVENGRNGVILDDLRKLPDILDYYLNGFKHWNEAVISSYELSKEYTTDKLLEEWRGVIDSIG